jgi:hypothetical protein
MASPPQTHITSPPFVVPILTATSKSKPRIGRMPPLEHAKTKFLAKMAIPGLPLIAASMPCIVEITMRRPSTTFPCGCLTTRTSRLLHLPRLGVPLIRMSDAWPCSSETSLSSRRRDGGQRRFVCDTQALLSRVGYRTSKPNACTMRCTL